MKAYNIITERILALLESGTVPWHKPWASPEAMPRNLVSKKPYRGINVMLLHCAGYASPYWLSYQQAREKGGHVRRGERGCPVVFWKWLETEDRATGELRSVPLLRYYTVFNVAQCDGVSAPATNAPQRPHTPIEAAETIVARMPARPPIDHGHEGASYSPRLDRVAMPQPELFHSAEGYYATLFHELTHATGHASRLHRKEIADTVIRFGSTDYSKEELVAEMGAAFLAGQAGISEPLIENSAAYIDGWLSRLRKDPKLVVHAAAQAQKAADFILGLDNAQPCAQPSRE